MGTSTSTTGARPVLARPVRRRRARPCFLGWCGQECGGTKVPLCSLDTGPAPASFSVYTPCFCRCICNMDKEKSKDLANKKRDCVKKKKQHDKSVSRRGLARVSTCGKRPRK